MSRRLCIGLHAARIIRARVLLISDQKTAFLYNICIIDHKICEWCSSSESSFFMGGCTKNRQQITGISFVCNTPGSSIPCQYSIICPTYPSDPYPSRDEAPGLRAARVEWSDQVPVSGSGVMKAPPVTSGLNLEWLMTWALCFYLAALAAAGEDRVCVQPSLSINLVSLKNDGPTAKSVIRLALGGVCVVFFSHGNFTQLRDFSTVFLVRVIVGVGVLVWVRDKVGWSWRCSWGWGWGWGWGWMVLGVRN